jgi:hypothetical protein
MAHYAQWRSGKELQPLREYQKGELNVTMARDGR